MMGRKAQVEIAILPCGISSHPLGAVLVDPMSILWGCRLLSQNTNLTSKEWAITALVSHGSTNTEIAESVHVPELMVKDLLRTIFAKTGCWTRVEVALWYLENGVGEERRLSDRREADSKITDERQQGRRHSTERSRRANEQHAINLDE